jgi:hypothetical protein
MIEEVFALLGREGVEGRADPVPESQDGALCDLSEVSFELREVRNDGSFPPEAAIAEPPFATLQKSGFSAFGTSESLLL